MENTMSIMFPSICMVLFLLGSSVARPTNRPSDQPLINRANLIRHQIGGDDAVEAIYERLKLGDVEAWREYGAEVVDVVYGLVEEGQADDPFDALLMLFYPNLTPQERKTTLTQFEPFLRKLVEQPVNNGNTETDQYTLYKRKSMDSQETSFAQDDQSDEEDEQLRNALRQLKIRPSESLESVPTIGGKKRPPEKRSGQKETPMYLGTHESPKGVSWRV